MNLEQMKAMVRDTVKDVAGPIVTDALKPLQERQTSWEQKMLGGDRPAAAPKEKGSTLARAALAYAVGKGNPEHALAFAKKRFGEQDLVLKALSTAVYDAGGALLKPEFALEFIDLLRAKVVVASLMPTFARSEVPVTWVKKTAGGTASYTGENQRIAATQIKTGTITATPHKIAAISALSNELINSPGSNADEIVRNDLIQDVAIRSDLAFIRGDGLSDTPKGLRNWAPAANLVTAVQAGASATLAEVEQLMSDLWLKLATNNVNMLRPGWIWHPRTTEYLRRVQNGLGVAVHKEEIDGGTYRGAPFRESTQIPTTLGGGTESEIYLTDFAEVILLESPQVRLVSSTDATYIDNAGVQHNAFQDDQTVVRITTANDLIMQHDLAAAVGTVVKWGA